jgi:hypothetical protein
MWEARRLTTLWTSTASYRDSFTLPTYVTHNVCEFQVNLWSCPFAPFINPSGPCGFESLIPFRVDYVWLTQIIILREEFILRIVYTDQYRNGSTQCSCIRHTLQPVLSVCPTQPELCGCNKDMSGYYKLNPCVPSRLSAEIRSPPAQIYTPASRKRLVCGTCLQFKL